MAILEFEKPLYEIEEKIQELKKISESSGMDVSDQIETFEKQALEYKKELYDYIMRLYYAASFDLTINVLCERRCFMPHLSTLFDYEKSLMDTKEDAIYDPFIDLYISGKTIKTILDNNPSMEKSINKVLGFNMKDALEKIEEQYNISIPDEVKNKYLEYDSSRKEFMEEKIYKRIP